MSKVIERKQNTALTDETSPSFIYFSSTIFPVTLSFFLLTHNLSLPLPPNNLFSYSHQL